MKEDTKVEKVTKLCLMAGKIMMECGAEVYRVEDTLLRIAAAAGFRSEIYVTVTGIFVNLFDTGTTQFVNIKKRTINLEKVALVNSYSRMFAKEELSLDEVYDRIKDLSKNTVTFSLVYQLISAGLVSSSLMILFGGSWYDFISTFCIGMIGYAVSGVIAQKIKINYFDSFGGALCIGLITVLLAHFGWVVNKDLVVLGSLMPLVPGVAITNSFRDILSGHLLSGVARGTEAVLIASAIGLGIALGGALF